MAVGPQYQSQLALLAGALGHGLDPTTGYSIYQDTLQQAQAAQQARQSQIQGTLQALAQTAQDAATGGTSPKSVGALVESAAAGLPRGSTHAVQHGINGILGALHGYTPPVDPMAQAQLQGQLIQNQQDMNAPPDISGEPGIYGPQHQALVANLTQQYFATGMPAAEIRQKVIAQLAPEFTQDVKVPATPTGVPTASGKPVPGGKMIDQQVVTPGTPGLIDKTISQTLAQIDPTYMDTHPGGALAAAAGLTPPTAPASAQPTLTGSDVIGALNQTPNNFGIGFMNPNANVPSPTQAPQGPPWGSSLAASLTLLRGLTGNVGGQPYG